MLYGAMTLLLAATNALAGTFEVVAQESGISPYRASFSIAWVDFNGDDLPDLFVSTHKYKFSEGRYPALYINLGEGRFVDSAAAVFAETDLRSDTHTSGWADYDNDGDQDVIISVGANLGKGSDPNLLLRNENGQLHAVADSSSPAFPNSRGRAPLWFDANSDGLLDVLLTSSRTNRKSAGTTLFIQTESGFEPSPLATDLPDLSPAFGAQLHDVTGDGSPDLVIHGTYRFPLSVFDVRDSLREIVDQLPTIGKLVAHRRDVLDHDSARDVAYADFDGDLNTDMFAIRASHSPDLYDAQSSHFGQGLPDIMWLFDPATGRFVDRSAESGFGDSTLSRTVVSGDFDNDMDVDLLVSTSSHKRHTGFLLYENTGAGRFVVSDTVVTSHGRHKYIYTLGTRIATADYDLDGDIDVFACPATIESGNSPAVLLRNRGNDNHWLEIDLEGVQSNRDGIGARVIVDAGGRQQVREQAGGMHLFAQNMPRLHFGLGGNEIVDRITVHWPSGIVQVVTDTRGDRLIRIREAVR
jgi:hypothetical protein